MKHCIKNCTCSSGTGTMNLFSLRKQSATSGKRGFHPCFCLPACCNCPVALSEFATCFIKSIKLRFGKFQKMQLQLENQTAKSNLLRKCGLLAHTSAAFLKNCCTEKLFRCLRLSFYSKVFFRSIKMDFGIAHTLPLASS